MGRGISECWFVVTYVRQTKDYVYWENFKHNRKENQKYNLSYKFYRAGYDKAIERIKPYIKN